MFLTDTYEFLTNYITRIFFHPGSTFFVGALMSTLVIATIHTVRRRLKKGRKVKVRTVIAGLFPGKIFRHRSMRADVFMFFLNTLMTGLLIGWAIVGFGTVSEGVKGALTSAFGPLEKTTLPDWFTRSLATLLFFLAYEFGYWFDHYIKHRSRILWEFHKVHHSAEHLTPMTVWRMHPIDSWIFANILSVTIGSVAGIYAWAMGGTVTAYALTGTNIILVVFIHIYLHLQHSEFWITFTGWRGKLLMSPAHHQIHHSDAVRHYDKNMGSCLAIWDWLFGTLYMPTKEREKFGFGIGEKHRDVHEMGEALFGPFRDAAGHVIPKPKRQHIEPAE